MRLMRGPLASESGVAGGGAKPGLELAVARAMLIQAKAGVLDEAVRVYRPTSPIVAFGRRDTRQPGFAGAVAAASAAGFTPVVRAVGGRAVAYTDAAVVVDHVKAEVGAIGGQDERFEEFGRRFVTLFQGYGVDARLGAVPGEYCPGAHSVNARGTQKLVGTAQRMTPGAWLFSSLLVVGDQERLRPVLAEVYACLGQDFDVASVGALSDEVPGLDAATLEDAVVAAIAPGAGAAPVGDDLVGLAHTLLDQHRVET